MSIAHQRRLIQKKMAAIVYRPMTENDLLKKYDADYVKLLKDDAMKRKRVSKDKLAPTDPLRTRSPICFIFNHAFKTRRCSQSLARHCSWSKTGCISHSKMRCLYQNQDAVHSQDKTVLLFQNHAVLLPRRQYIVVYADHSKQDIVHIHTTCVQDHGIALIHNSALTQKTIHCVLCRPLKAGHCAYSHNMFSGSWHCSYSQPAPP